MKIMLVEDDIDKKEKVKKFLASKYSSALIVEKESLRSALKELISDNGYNLVILDMSLPNFDINKDEPGGGTPESFAGREMMAQMKLRGMSIPTIIVTQYSTFEGGRVTLEELKQNFNDSFGEFYLGAVYYNAASEGWKHDLSELLKSINR